MLLWIDCSWNVSECDIYAFLRSSCSSSFKFTVCYTEVYSFAPFSRRQTFIDRNIYTDSLFQSSLHDLLIAAIQCRLINAWQHEYTCYYSKLTLSIWINYYNTDCILVIVQNSSFCLCSNSFDSILLPYVAIL